MSRRPRLRELATTAAVAIGLTACGSSGLSRAELLSRSNSICASAQKAASAVPSPSNLQHAAAYFNQIAPITAKETSELDALRPASSASVSSAWNAFISAQKSANGVLQTIRSSIDARRPLGLQGLRQVSGVGQRVQSAATELGAFTCAQ